VAFPAAATVLTSRSGFDLSKSQYSLLFVPPVVIAITGSLAIPGLARLAVVVSGRQGPVGQRGH
jgi:hypothetical protein